MWRTRSQHMGGGGSGGNCCEEYKVPDKLVGLVIGRGGEQLHRLQADTQCKVQIAPDANGDPDRNFTLVGTKDAIERAKRSIDEILKRGSSLGSDPSNPGSSTVLQRNNCEIVELKIPGNKCGLIIGKGGETIKRLSEQYGVKLVVVQETSSASGSEKPLRITGEPDKVSAAKAAIMEMLNPVDDYRGRRDGGERKEYGERKPYFGGGGGGGGPNQQEAFIKVPGDKAGIVIGKGGESIKDINRRSGAHVEIDRSQRGATDGNDKMFVIKGDQEQIQYAQQLIYEKITGVQGSQPPQGYFNDPNQGSPGQGGYGGQQGGGGGYGGQQQQQQQQYMGYQQAGQAQSSDPNVSAAWAAYYQQYYGAAGQPGASAQPAAAAVQQQQPAATAASPSVNPTTGQADYSQAWVEYYRSLGMHEQAEAILKQTAASATAGGGGAAEQQAQAQPAQAKPAQAQHEQKQTNGGGGGYNGSSGGGGGGQYGGQSQGGYGGSGGYGGQSQGYNREQSSGGYNREQRSGGH